jgi:cell filamentation protein
MPSKIELEQAEGRYVSLRLLALKSSPIKGDFDFQHMQAIHQYLFQDLGKVSPFHQNKYSPGEFRQEVPYDEVHVKQRHLKKLALLSEVIYSNMDKLIMQETADYLKDALEIDKLKQMDTQAFSKRIANVYAQLDFLHPFKEGNSRTLREFTREIGLTAGFDLHWEKVSQNDKARDLLYAARDIEVNKIALSVEEDEPTRKDISHFLSALQAKKTKSLQEIVEENIEKLGMEKIAKMDAAEIKQKIEEQKKVSMAMKKAIAIGENEFEYNNKRYVKQGNVFAETEKNPEQKKALSPKEKLQQEMVNKQKNLNKGREI